MEEKQPVDLKAICATTEAGKVALCNCTTGEFDGSFVIPGRKNPNQVRIGWATTRQMLQANNNTLDYLITVQHLINVHSGKFGLYPYRTGI